MRHLLLAMGHDDPVVVLGMLQIIFCKHGITSRQCITRHRDVLFRDMGRRTTNFDVRTVGLIAASQWVLAFAVIIIPTAASAVLL